MILKVLLVIAVIILTILAAYLLKTTDHLQYTPTR